MVTALVITCSLFFLKYVSQQETESIMLPQPDSIIHKNNTDHSDTDLVRIKKLETLPVMNHVAEQYPTLSALIYNNEDYIYKIYELISAINDEDEGVYEYLLAKVITHCSIILPIRERMERQFTLAAALPIPDEDISFMSFLVREIDKCLPLENERELENLGLELNHESLLPHQLALFKNAALKGNVSAAAAYLTFHPMLDIFIDEDNQMSDTGIETLDGDMSTIIKTALTSIADTDDPNIILYLSSMTDNRYKARTFEYYACSKDDFCNEPFNRFAVVAEYLGCIEHKILMTTHLLTGSQQSCKQQVTLDAYVYSLPNLEQTAIEAKNIAYHLQKKDFQAAGLGRLVKLLELLESRN